MAQATTADGQSRRSDRLVSGVLWNWAGIGVQLFTGVIVSPYIIRKLGTERYGIWALVFSLASYYGFIDLGFRSAVVRFSAHYYTRRENPKVNELINTTFFYFSLAAAVLVCLTLILWRLADRIFRVPPALRDEFSLLVLIVGISISVGLNMSVFSGVVEGLQRFDISNRIRIVIFGLRGAGWFLLLMAGYGLVAMGWWSLATSVVFFLLYLLYLRRIFPALEFSRRFVTLSMFTETVSYGLHTFLASIGTQSLDQTPSLLIGYFRRAADVGYYNFPLRAIQYVSQAITNVGVVALPHAASLAAEGRLDKVASLGIYANRYCLSLFMPLAVFLTVYGTELFAIWVTPEFARNAVYLLPPLIAGFGLGQAAQFCTGSILFGLGEQKMYARAIVGEAAASIVFMVVVIPRYGVYGAAVVAAGLMAVTRGCIGPWILCRRLGFSFQRYMRSILAPPLAASVPAWLALWWLKRWGVLGKNWSELILAGGVVCALYGVTALYLCVSRDHRKLLFSWAGQRLGRRDGSQRHS